MKQKLAKTDRIFLVALSIAILIYVMVIFTFPSLLDEAFYASIPFRLLQGDTLLQHEWHLTQFSSLFTYLPVRFWLAMKGSSQGLILFLRVVYLLIHIAATGIVYRHFRFYGKWAVAASILFFLQTPYRLLAVSYNSMFAIFILFLVLCMDTLSQTPSKRLFFFAGLCVGCCCICNPLFVCVYIIYLLICIFLKTRNKKNFATSLLNSGNLFLHKEAIPFSFLGIITCGIVLLVFLILTGGSVPSIFSNASMLLQSSEYRLGFHSVFEKLKETYGVFRDISLKLPFVLPVLYIIMIADKKRYTTRRRQFYISAALALAILYILGIALSLCYGSQWRKSAFFSLPMAIIGITCYILTKQKNTRMFYCIWLPCFIAASLQLIASNSLLTAFGFMMAVGNVAGVFFARDLHREMTTSAEAKPKAHWKRQNFAQRLISFGLCLQLLFQLVICLFGQLPAANGIRATAGPYAGMSLTTDQNDYYSRYLRDLDHIKATNTAQEPLLIVSVYNWMYLYAELPIATYTTWFEGTLQPEHLLAYYQENPDKIPAYIYVDSLFYDQQQENLQLLSTMFVFSAEPLSRGIMLTIEGLKF